MNVAKDHSHIHTSLALRAGEGDSSAQFKLYELYYNAMYNTALRIVKDKMLAEELMQDSFLSAYNKMNQWQQKSSFGAWLKRIVINHCIDYLNKKKPASISMEEMQVSGQEDESIQDPIYQVGDVKAAMTQLPNGYRTILSLYLFEGYDHEEIGQILNISSSTSRSQYLRAKKKLIELIKTKVYVG